MKNICILGLGYIGLPTAAMFATHGIKVHGVDINDKIIEILNNGEIHIEEPGLKTLVQAAIKSENLSVNCQPEPADAFIIAVPTPFKHDEYGEYEGKRYKLADMGAVTSAAEAIVPHLREGNLVILESTSPPKTTIDLVAPILEKSGLKAGKDFYLAYSPERVLPGQILRELIENDRVIGGINPASAEKGKELYSTFVKGEIVLTDATTAEMVKLMENTYRDVNIAIANEFSQLADRFGVDVWEAISIANRHPRVKILKPGPGVGGHCISVDPWFLVEAAPNLTDLIYTSRIVNDGQPKFIVDMIKGLLGEYIGKTIAVLGLSYKPNVDDFRESPAIEICNLLIENEINVQAIDPYMNNKSVAFHFPVFPDFKYVSTNFDMLAILVGHKEFIDLEPCEISKLVSTKIILDSINVLDNLKWKQEGFSVYSLNSIKI